MLHFHILNRECHIVYFISKSHVSHLQLKHIQSGYSPNYLHDMLGTSKSSIHPEMVKRRSMSALRQYLRILTVYIIDILDQFVILFLTGDLGKTNQIAFRGASFAGNRKHYM